MGKPFKCERVPYMREILDSFNPSKPSKEVVIIKGCSVGGTEASLNELIANNPILHIDERRRFGAIQVAHPNMTKF